MYSSCSVLLTYNIQPINSSRCNIALVRQLSRGSQNGVRAGLRVDAINLLDPVNSAGLLIVGLQRRGNGLSRHQFDSISVCERPRFASVIGHRLVEGLDAVSSAVYGRRASISGEEYLKVQSVSGGGRADSKSEKL